MSRGRDGQGFSPATVREIRRRAGHRCCQPDCLALTSGGADSEACHIFAAAKDNGPRGTGGKQPEGLRSADNGILLCRVHHGLADLKASPLPAHTLQEWKLVRELSHDLNRRDNDIRNWTPHIAPRRFDGFIWEQLNERRSDADFDLARDLDMARIKSSCLVEMLASFTKEGPRQGSVETPKHMRLTPVAQCLLAPMHLPPSTGPVADHAILAEPPEVAPVLELIRDWRAQVPAIGAPPQPDALISCDLTVGFGARHGANDAPVAAVAKNTTVWFNSSPPSIDDGLVLWLSCLVNEAKWVFSVKRSMGCWKVDSHLEPVLNGFPEETARPGLYEEALAWERLLSALTSGSELMGYFGLRPERQAGPFGDPQFHPAPVKIDMKRLPGDWLPKSLWRVRRILLALDLSRVTGAAPGGALHWIFTTELFDERISDKVLKDAAPFLKQAVEQGASPWEHQLAEIDGVPWVLRYKHGEATVCSGFRYRKNRA